MRLAVRCKPPLFNTEIHAKKMQMPISDVIVSLFGSFHHDDNSEDGGFATQKKISTKIITPPGVGLSQKNQVY